MIDPTSEMENVTPASRTTSFRPTASEVAKWFIHASDSEQVAILKEMARASHAYSWPLQCRAIEIAFGQESTFEVRDMLETLVDHLGDRSTIITPGMKSEA